MRVSPLRLFGMFYLIIVGLSGVVAPGFSQTSQPATQQFDSLIAATKARMLVDPAGAVVTAKQAALVAQALDPELRNVSIATSERLQGEAYVRMNNTVKAKALIDHAISLVSSSDRPTKLNGDLLVSRGGVDTFRADVAAALSDYQQAHAIYVKIGDIRSQAIAIVSIGILYQEAEDYKTAIKYYEQIDDLDLQDEGILISVLVNKGLTLQGLKRFSESQAVLRSALAIAERLKSDTLKAQILRNIARGQLQQGQAQAADRTIAMGFAASRGADAAASRGHFLILSAWSARLHGRLAEAERLIRAAFGSTTGGGSTLDLRDGHRTAYDIFKQTGNQAQALIHLEALKTFDDKTSTLAASANTALAAARFDFANQELKIEKLRRAELQRSIVDAKERAQTQFMMLVGLAGASLIIVALLAFGLITLRRSRNEVRAANVDLGATNAALGKALAAKTEFLATTSHEIRTPLNGILGMTQVMLVDQTLTSALRDRIGVVHSAGVTMRALVDDILDVAKMETGNLTIEHVPFDLKTTLRDVSRMWGEQAAAKGLAFTLDLEACPAFIEGDPARLRQIAFNLLSNAMKFTEAGSVTVRALASDATLSLSVTDTGIGIPADKLEIIFESFRQVDAGTTRKFGGTGLGLAICRNLARAMDGDVSVISTPDAGSTFTLSLPLLLAAAPVDDATDPTEDASALLIVDRNPISRAMLRAVLQPRAGTVVFAANAVEAITRMGEGGIGHVLIDDTTIKNADDVDAALASLAAGDAITALLWSAPDAADRARFTAAGIDHIIARPIAGAALADILFETPTGGDLQAKRPVTSAA